MVEIIFFIICMVAGLFGLIALTLNVIIAIQERGMND